VYIQTPFSSEVGGGSGDVFVFDCRYCRHVAAHDHSEDANGCDTQAPVVQPMALHDKSHWSSRVAIATCHMLWHSMPWLRLSRPKVSAMKRGSWSTRFKHAVLGDCHLGLCFLMMCAGACTTDGCVIMWALNTSQETELLRMLLPCQVGMSINTFVWLITDLHLQCIAAQRAPKQVHCLHFLCHLLSPLQQDTMSPLQQDTMSSMQPRNAPVLP
jgi:hypothetical protein